MNYAVINIGIILMLVTSAFEIIRNDPMKYTNIQKVLNFAKSGSALMVGTVLILLLLFIKALFT